MKLYFKILFFFIFFFPSEVLCEDIINEYLVKTRGILIGDLIWRIDFDNNSYETHLSLNSRGFLSSIYTFKGDYKSEGIIKNNKFISETYTQDWNTKKQQKKIKIIFEDQKIKKLKILPKEKEYPRINIKKIENYLDPLTSFINILIHNEPSFTIDGRRTYVMTPKKNGTKKNHRN